MLIPKGTQAVYVGDTIGWEWRRGKTCMVRKDTQIVDEICDDSHETIEVEMEDVFRGPLFVYIKNLSFDLDAFVT